MENRTGASNRRSRRSKVLLSATLEFGDSSHPVTLRDLSEYGALVEGAHLARRESQVLFRRNDLCIPGRVAWVEGEFAGIAFQTPLELAVLLRHVPRRAARPVPSQMSSRPPVSRHQLSPQEQQWIDHWMSTAGKDPLGD